MTNLSKGLFDMPHLARGLPDLYIMGRKAFFGDLTPYDGHDARTACPSCGSYHVVRLKDKREACRRCGKPRP